MTVVFMMKEKVSSHRLQSIESCLRDKYIRERDANTQRDGPQFVSEDVPGGLREEMKLAGGREDKAEAEGDDALG